MGLPQKDKKKITLLKKQVILDEDHSIAISNDVANSIRQEIKGVFGAATSTKLLLKHYFCLKNSIMNMLCSSYL